jgi:cold-inducible RNA-binding protein
MQDAAPDPYATAAQQWGTPALSQQIWPSPSPRGGGGGLLSQKPWGNPLGVGLSAMPSPSAGGGQQILPQKQWGNPHHIQPTPVFPVSGSGFSRGGGGDAAAGGAGPRPGTSTARVPVECSVYVNPCPQYWDETALVERFQAFGNVVSCSIVADKVTGQRKGFAFVNFEKAASASAAAAGMNGLQIDSMHRLQVSVKGVSGPGGGGGGGGGRAAPY